MRSKHVKYIAICGVFAGVAVTIMCLGGLIPIATYVTPMVCTLIAHLILTGCGRSYALTWYLSVTIIVLLLNPDKEAASLFVVFGTYPVLKQIFEKSKLQILLKAFYFNSVIGLLYYLLGSILGLSNISEEYSTLGAIGLGILVVLGNITFFLLDKILSFNLLKSVNKK